MGGDRRRQDSRRRRRCRCGLRRAPETYRLPRARRDAGLRQRPHACADDAPARARRRSAPRRLADGVHDAGRAGVRAARFRRARHEARLRGDDPVGDHLLRRHVLLRGFGGRRRPRRPACARSARRPCSSFPRRTPRASRTRWPRAREFIVRWKGARAHRSRGGAARALHVHRGDSPGVRGARRRVRRAASHPPVRDRVRGGAVPARARHAGRPVGEEAAAVRRARAGRPLRARGRRRDPHAEAMRGPAWRTTRRAT